MTLVQRHANGTNSVVVSCPTNYVVTGGGGGTLNGSAVAYDGPLATSPTTGWQVRSVSTSAKVVAYVFCATQ